MVLRRADQLGDGRPVLRAQFLRLAVHLVAQVEVSLLEHVVDHALQAHRTTVIGVVQPRDAVGVQLLDLFGQDRPATAAKDLDVPRALLLQQVVHVLEVLRVPALVARHGDGVRVFLDRGVHHVLHATVVPQVDHLGAGALDDAPHNVDRGVMTIEK